MYVHSADMIIAEINAHMRQSGISNVHWYVGITSDLDQRLFGYHRVPRQNHWFITRRAPTSEQARAIEALYHHAGCAGAGGGGDDTTVFVYAYVMTGDTVE